MFDLTTDYPKAVASYDDEGLDAAIEWCVGHAADGDVVSVWTSLVSNLKNCTKLERFVNRYSDVEHITGRGFSMPSPGPVLMAWPRMDGIGELLRFASRIRALCVLTWDEDEIRPWVTAAQPEILGDGSAWDKLTDPLDPVVLEALKSVTLTINLNNTIKGGYEKDDVVGVLRALYESGVPMDGKAMQGWALANGWSGDNPAQLAKYVDDINVGKRPKTSRRLGRSYVDQLREKAAAARTQREA